ncbi:MAG: site-2 protease family protein [Saprospiraceae bacterium]|nr:site-2 protease family protein [Saprospiraceae bacterium]
MFDTGTIKLAKIAGIPIRLHWSFLLIFVWVGYNAWQDNLSTRGFIFMQLYVLILFVCVILHEYGHALVARKYGHKTRDILLTPIGGIARLESISEKPVQEFWIAIAGPLVNVAIALMLGLIILITGQRNILDALRYPGGGDSFIHSFLPLTMLSNIILAVFNFIPAFPMDGGRILRALLSTHWPRYKATLIAARVGQALAIVFLIFAVSQGHWMLCLVSLFIFVTAGNELKQVKWESILAVKPVKDLINTKYEHIQAGESMHLPVETALRGIEKNYLVYNGDALMGYLSHAAVMYAYKMQRQEAPVASFTRTEVPQVDTELSLKDALHLMQSTGATLLPVVENGLIIGAVDEDQIKKYVEIALLLKT